MKKFLVLSFIFGLGSILYAQTPKITRQVTKVLVEQPAVAKGTISQYGGARSGVMGVNYYLQHNMPKTKVSVATTQRSWWEQQQRNRKAHQLHKTRQARDLQEQIQAQEIAARQAILAKLPKANLKHQFITQDFTPFLPETIPAEELPLATEPGILFRGLALPADGQAVQNILQNGLRVADTGKEANTRNLAMGGGMPGMGQALANTPVTNLTSFPMNAATWAVKRMTDEKQLIAIVAVNGQTQAGKTVLVAQDIPADQITHLFVPLNLNNAAVWCKIELTENSAFLVTPYDIAPAEK